MSKFGVRDLTRYALVHVITDGPFEIIALTVQRTEAEALLRIVVPQSVRHREYRVVTTAELARL